MTTKKPKGLGRGLDALLGGSASFTEDTSNTANATASLPISALQAGKYQPRIKMDEAALRELADSIRSQGVLQAILVRPIEGANGGVTHEIIAGERRFRAAKLAGLNEVPVLVREVNDQAAAAMALIENMQREDLNPMEEAKGVQRLIEEFKFTHEQAAEAVGRSRSAVSNLLRLLNLAKPVQSMLMAGDLDMGHARALLAVDAATQIALGNEIVAKKLSVRDAEKLATRASLGRKTSKKGSKAEKSRDLVRLEEALSDTLATSVSIKMNARKAGEVAIAFASLDQLDEITKRLGAEPA
ncbi:MAG: ParB/RepB/Spo0J family partition protein [Oxalobacteraceae bacterium]|nr:ParB/RepB/Spo0J family partition protein [Oxalobacteraceae bacterium]